MPQHPLCGLAQAAGSRELLPRTASGLGFDFEGEIPRHGPDWHAALRRDSPLLSVHGVPALTPVLSAPSSAAPSPHPLPTDFAGCKGALFT